MTTRLSGTLGRVLIVVVLSGAIGACTAESSDSAVEEDLARQIQGELDAAVAASPAAFASVRPLRPILKCVEHLDSTHLRAHFGYTNSSTSAIPVRVGFTNRFWPPPIDRGQPTTFSAGSQADVVQVPFGRSAASIWVLGEHFAIATRFSKTCPAGGSGGATGSGTGGSGPGGAAGGFGAGGFGVGGLGVGGFGQGGSGTGGGVGGGAVGGAPGCPTNCDDHNPCTIDICSAGTSFQCVNTPLLDSTRCDDGNPCTVEDFCLSGQCVAGPPKACGPVDDCHLAGVCDAATGACSSPVRADNISCTLRDGCNFSGQCHAGVCLRGADVTCNTACDQCTFGGAPDICSATADGCFNCSQETDGCQFIVDPTDRTLCENLYACLIAPTHPGTSVPGSCLAAGDPLACWCGTNPGSCITDNAPPTQANGPCLAQFLAAAKTTDAAVVNQRLINPAYPIGRAFNVALCQETYCASECQLPPPVAPCPPPLEACHVAGLRDPVTGVCSDPPARDGLACDDGNACTVGDTCQAGTCVGGTVCPADQCRAAGTCDASTHQCTNPAKPDGTTCSVTAPCGSTGTCSAGFCHALTDLCFCEQCTFGPGPGQIDLCSASAEGCDNCDSTVAGCGAITDPADQFACQDLYTCLVATTHPGSVVPGACIQAADSLPCWCGTNRLTCASSNDPATQANGPCLTKIFAAAKSTDAGIIAQRFIDPNFPLGRAVNLANCRSAFCSSRCGVPF